MWFGEAGNPGKQRIGYIRQAPIGFSCLVTAADDVHGAIQGDQGRREVLSAA